MSRSIFKSLKSGSDHTVWNYLNDVSTLVYSILLFQDELFIMNKKSSNFCRSSSITQNKSDFKTFMISSESKHTFILLASCFSTFNFSHKNPFPFEYSCNIKKVQDCSYNKFYLYSRHIILENIQSFWGDKLVPFSWW